MCASGVIDGWHHPRPKVDRKNMGVAAFVMSLIKEFVVCARPVLLLQVRIGSAMYVPCVFMYVCARVYR